MFLISSAGNIFEHFEFELKLLSGKFMKTHPWYETPNL